MHSIRKYCKYIITIIVLFLDMQIYLMCYVETEISISPYSVHFRQKALKVILLYYLQILFMVYYLWCVYFFCCNKKTSQLIPSVIIYFFCALDFNFSENNMFQKFEHLVLHKPLFWNPASSWKNGEFRKCFDLTVFDEFISFL